MVLHLTDDLDGPEWRKAGISLPQRVIPGIRAYSNTHPYWVHFGAGNLFRALHGVIAQDLIDSQAVDSGVFVVETFDPEIVDRIYAPFSNRFLQVVLHADGTTRTRLITSVAEAFAIRNHDESWTALAKIFMNPELQLVTTTITEKAYTLITPAGQLLPWVRDEVQHGPECAMSAIGAITALLFERYHAGGFPIALVSTDNFSQNGDRFRASVITMASLWQQSGFVDEGFLSYVGDRQKVSFPLTMIDRITPNPAVSVGEALDKYGLADMAIVHTRKGTNIAPFSNTELSWYLVIEDAFPNGRPDFESAGVLIADRNTVNRADEMKVTTCLNPIHTALAIFGMLLGYDTMSEAIGDGTLHALVERLGYAEDLPVAPDPGIIDPDDFLREVIDERIPNPYIPDSPARISADTSQKIPIRFGVTIGKYLGSLTLDAASLIAIPLVIAGWLRLLMGADGNGIRDDGTTVRLSSDPRLLELQTALAELNVGGDMSKVDEVLRSIVSDTTLFGTDLSVTAIYPNIRRFFVAFASGTQTVIPTIRQALSL